MMNAVCFVANTVTHHDQYNIRTWLDYIANLIAVSATV